jgi:hypothetical protein
VGCRCGMWGVVWCGCCVGVVWWVVGGWVVGGWWSVVGGVGVWCGCGVWCVWVFVGVCGYGVGVDGV